MRDGAIDRRNPCWRTAGPGPVEMVCGLCAHLAATRAAATTIYYCAPTGQAKRVTWPACAHFAAAPRGGAADPRVDACTT